MRKVVVTGLGAATPLGTGVKKSWEAALNAQSGVSLVQTFPADSLAVKMAGEVSDFVVEDWISKKEQKQTSRFIHLALASACQAIESSGLDFEKDDQLRKQTGTLIGVGMGALPVIEDVTHKVAKGLRPSPFFIPSVIANSPAGQVSIKWGLRGANFSTVSACSSGAHAIGEAYHWIREGRCEVVIAGGAESALSPVSFQGFHSMRALSTRNEEPEKASRPWDKDRDGFIMSEGSAVIVLEEEKRARERKAHIYAELSGYGASSDAFHIAAPEPQGKGAELAMQKALESAQIDKEDVNYINAHGTSTPAGDKAEAQAITSLFGNHSQKLWISSSKSLIGHTLGAAGAIEALFSILSLHEQTIHPTINLDKRDESVPTLDFVPHQAREGKIKTVLSNSFGFGGTNVCLVFQKY